LEASIGQVELDAELTFEDRASHADFGTGAKSSDAIDRLGCGVGIGNGRNGIEADRVVDNGIEARVGKSRLPSIGDGKITARVFFARSTVRIWGVETSHVAGRLEGLETSNGAGSKGREAAGAEVAVLENGGPDEKNAGIGFLIFREKQLDV